MDHHRHQRPLPRPDADLEDQGLAFDLGTLDRRRVLRVLGLGAVAVGVAACGSTTPASTTSPGEIPDETAGPFPGDGSTGANVLTRSGIVRSDIRTSFGGPTGVAEGVPMVLELTVADLARGGSPFAGAAVYVWHCNREGDYSLYSERIAGENYLRGVQIADAAGRVRFTSIVPACYEGRWPHVHLEVYPDAPSIVDAGNAIATSQVALPEDTCRQVYAQPGYEQSATALDDVTLTSDNVFGDDGGASQLATVTGDVATGYTVALPVRIDTRTAPAAGGPGGPDGAPPGVRPSR
ncbi:intradiol ring-cleavage dioxygenase [Actinomycetospora straminea]|uniref:Intradiol ring-cleavage dioxygenase n=1 Tax=Actinomycetospora straminea TaxID=663607 RepID=A0ABP9EVK9_9PSEU|nr:intradiol ring-cleavage dioxygenase [Actinomycetospora straminea]MDD7933010.1 intradiol ring-cleavage dioxygenase [Actinomycetospora straminea]